MAVITQIQIRRGTAASWTSTNPTLAAGELGLETDTGYIKAGNGTTAWNSLTYVNQFATFPNLSTNAQSGTTYTLALSDASKIVELNNSSAITLTVPLNASVAFAVGTQIQLLQTGTGQVTVTGSGTINSGSGLKLRAQWSMATLIKRASDTWVLVGDTTA